MNTDDPEVFEEPLQEHAVVEYVGSPAAGRRWVRAEAAAAVRAQEFHRRGEALHARIAVLAPWFGPATGTWTSWEFITCDAEHYGATLCQVHPATTPVVVDELVVTERVCWQLADVPAVLDDPEERLRAIHYPDRDTAAAAVLDLLDEALDHASDDDRDGSAARVQGWAGLAELLAASAALHAGLRELPDRCWLVVCSDCREPLEGEDDAIVHFPTRTQALDAARRDEWVVESATVTGASALVCLDCQQRAAARLTVADDVDTRTTGRDEHRGPGPGQLPLDTPGARS